jgi:hypothetical protein
MERTIVKLFENRADAMEAVEALERSGVSDDHISVIASNKDSWFGSGAANTDYSVSDDNRGADGAVTGASTGAVVGGGAGVLAGLGLLAIPGLGPIVAAGWLASMATGVVAGAAIGGAAGGVIGALIKSGISEEDAQLYSEGLNRGGTLVSVRTTDASAPLVESTLDGFNPAGVQHTREQYMSSGWNGFS